MKNPVDIEQFIQLIKACSPSSELSLYSFGTEFAWFQDGSCIARSTLDINSWTQTSDGSHWLSVDEGELLASPILDEHGRVTHYLIVLSQIEPTSRESLYKRLAPTLQAITTSLNAQMNLNRELDAMARELAVRYEELNLVYYTDDEVRFLDEGRQALGSLVENCNEYLNVDLTAFLMPDQGMYIVQSAADSQIDSESILPALQHKLVEILKTENRTIVINNADDTLASLGFANPIVASPVHDGNGQISGALVIVRKRNSPDFVNSDRNLLVVMAGKASKIVQSSYDGLTGLMRQEGFDRSLASALAHAEHSNKKHALLHVNIDRMHLINDTIGYHAGDTVLQSVATELRSKLRDTDRIARLGGDEFGILLHGCSIGHGETVAEKLCQSISALKIEFDGQVVDVSACVGVAALDKDSGTTVSAHAGAEIACSVAKERGRNRWHVYYKDDSSLKRRHEQMEWVGRLKTALEEDQFRLFCQKIVPLRDELEGYHFEVLVRMTGEDGEILSPAMFLPVAERYQMMPALDRWIVENTFKALATHVHEMTEQKVVCSINLSGQSLVDQDFIPFIMQQFEFSAIPPALICFEVTETAAIANLDEAQRFMNELRAFGCSFSLDDFGVGLSSFAYLRTLPVDYLKLDGSFVTPIAEDETAAAMLTAMNTIGQIVGLQTVAEFVESEAVINRLKEIGVDYGQGYGIGKPRPLTEELDELSAVALSA